MLDGNSLASRDSDEEVRRPIQHLFLFIGAEPNTDWLSGSGVALDPKGFVLTGAEASENRQSLETSRPGRIRHRRRPVRFGQARRRRGRRRRAGGGGAACFLGRRKADGDHEPLGWSEAANALSETPALWATKREERFHGQDHL